MSFKLTLASLFKTLQLFALTSSFHGINHLFGPKRWKVKILWFVLSITFTILWTNFLITSLETYFITQPTTTKLKYIHSRHSLSFPDVLICPVLRNQSMFDQFVPGNLAPLLSLLTTLSVNPTHGMIRRALSDNISAAFEQFPELEKQWQKIYRSESVDPIIAQYLGK